jgi:hypothetical protein
MRPPRDGAAQAPAVDVEEADASTSSALVEPPQDPSDPWQPVGSVLERLFQSFDFVPTADDDDPRWKRWHCRPGDLAEVCGANGDSIGRLFVTAASPLHFKLEDRRVFAQQGWPIVSGKKSPIRARKVRE